MNTYFKFNQATYLQITDTIAEKKVTETYDNIVWRYDSVKIYEQTIFVSNCYINMNCYINITMEMLHIEFTKIYKENHIAFFIHSDKNIQKRKTKKTSQMFFILRFIYFGLKNLLFIQIPTTNYKQQKKKQCHLIVKIIELVILTTKYVN